MIERLASHVDPVIIGVRHHSAALAAVLPGLLDTLGPSELYVESPPELEVWFPWLGHAELEAPVVLAAARPGRLGFYPFADFSPELAAIRWAVREGIPVYAIDAPVRAELPSGGPTGDDRFDGVLKASGARDLGDFWDQQIEARASTATPEQLRRAGLAVGWALRQAGVGEADATRECAMRARLATAAPGSVAIVGAFHAAGLLEGPEVPLVLADEEPVTSLVPYTWDLFDSRSGYPAGVRDPALQQAFYEAFSAGVPPVDVLGDALVRVSRALRALGHTGGVPDSQEALRMCIDLARLRGREHPGRSELMEAIETCMARGQRLGRGLALARAMESALVGRKQGRIPREAPISGLRRHLEQLVQTLRLPGERDPEKSLRLTPLRSELDRARHLALLRMHTAQIHYASEVPGQGAMHTVGVTWTVKWETATAATASLAGVHGVTLEQAAGGVLLTRWRRLERDDALTCAAQLELLATAAEAGLLETAGLALEALWGTDFVHGAGLPELIGAVRLVSRIEAGLAVGTAPEAVEGADAGPLYRAGIRQLEGLSGSEDPDDVRAMAELVNALEATPLRPTLDRALAALADDGGPLVQGAARALQVVLGAPGASFGTWLASTVEAARSPEARTALRARLVGVLTVGEVLMASDPEVLAPLEAWVDSTEDAAFLERLPAVRGGFEALSPAARQRFLDGLKVRYGGFDDVVALDPVLLGVHAEADRLAALGLELPPAVPVGELDPPVPRAVHGPDRWRLILGRERRQLSGRAHRAAGSLDELYGRGEGEGSRASEGGDGEGRPSLREWSGELEALFGARVRDEVLATAGEGGRAAAFTELDPDTVRPSVEVLQQLLSLAGSLGEASLEPIRRMVQRIVDELVKALALRVQPALRGATLPRPTRRNTGVLDLPRTVRRNLARLQQTDDGVRLVPEVLVFKSGSRRTVDWELHLLVDVSGSMEASVLYSAMMAGILSAVPWLGVNFYAFDTQVLDLTEHAADPLALLLEVKVGGGTNIGRAVQYAAERISVPARAMVVIVSDFEEGGSVDGLLANIDRLVRSGTKVLGVAALDDSGKAVYHVGIASQVAALGVPVAAVSPLELARWIGEVVHG